MVYPNPLTEYCVIIDNIQHYVSWQFEILLNINKLFIKNMKCGKSQMGYSQKNQGSYYTIVTDTYAYL